MDYSRNLENLPEVSYGQVDKGIYHTEEEYSSENSGFEISDGTFTINDRLSPNISKNLFTSEELNNAEEFDFSGGSQNESTVEEFDFSGGSQNESTVEEFDFSGGSQNESTVEEFDFSDGSQNESIVEEFDLGGKTEENFITNELKQENDAVLSPQPYSEYANNSVPLQAKPYADMYGTPPQIIGYDQNGMPVYAQPQIYPQSQFLGYDQNGMPVYSQPVVYQPQIIGYDQNGMPVYSQPISYPQSQVMNYAHPSVYAENVQKQEPVDEETKKFRDFLDDGKTETTPTQKEENFFGKSSDMGDVSLPDLDIGGLKKREKKKKVYMTDVEIQDAENLVPNNASKFNQKYMRQANETGSGDLGEKTNHKKRVEMNQTKTADPRLLNPKFQHKSRIKMGDATTAQTDDFNTKTVRQRKVSMAEANHAVEAMPKKKKYVDELDLIELPEYMQARKKSKKDKPDFPSMSDL